MAIQFRWCLGNSKLSWQLHCLQVWEEISGGNVTSGAINVPCVYAWHQNFGFPCSCCAKHFRTGGFSDFWTHLISTIYKLWWPKNLTFDNCPLLMVQKSTSGGSRSSLKWGDMWKEILEQSVRIILCLLSLMFFLHAKGATKHRRDLQCASGLFAMKCWHCFLHTEECISQIDQTLLIVCKWKKVDFFHKRTCGQKQTEKNSTSFSFSFLFFSKTCQIISNSEEFLHSATRHDATGVSVLLPKQLHVDLSIPL